MKVTVTIKGVAPIHSLRAGNQVTDPSYNNSRNPNWLLLAGNWLRVGYDIVNPLSTANSEAITDAETGAAVTSQWYPLDHPNWVNSYQMYPDVLLACEVNISSYSSYTLAGFH